jgi:hypothetical protein
MPSGSESGPVPPFPSDMFPLDAAALTRGARMGSRKAHHNSCTEEEIGSSHFHKELMRNLLPLSHFYVG